MYSKHNALCLLLNYERCDVEIEQKYVKTIAPGLILFEE